MVKSSVPTNNSFLSSLLKSPKAMHIVFPPKTVQNLSSPLISTPTILQLPPARHRGSTKLENFPQTKLNTPSVISLSNNVRFSIIS